MSIEDILQALDEQCNEECQEIFQKAQSEVEEILAKARLEAEEIRESKMAKVKMEVENERASLFYSARLKGKNTIIAAKEEVLTEALNRAQEIVEQQRSHEDYPKVFSTLLREALDRIEGEGVVHVDPRDEQLARDTLEGMGLFLAVVPDIECSGGVIVSDKEDKVHIVNTFEERLKRARERLKLTLSEILFEEAEKKPLFTAKT